MINKKNWNLGDNILLRGVWFQKIWFAIVSYVVRDDDDLIALYWQAGTPNRIPKRRLTGYDFLSEFQPQLIESTWTRTDLLMLVKPGASHSVEVMWDRRSGDFLCWYINLQQPLHRTLIGFDTMDYALDIVINPDRSQWHWKDEDEFEELIRLQLITSDIARHIRSEGEKVIQQARANQKPFCDGWETWTPPGNWPILKFPSGWDLLESLK